MCGSKLSASAVARIRSTEPEALPPVRAPRPEATSRPEPRAVADPVR